MEKRIMKESGHSVGKEECAPLFNEEQKAQGISRPMLEDLRKMLSKAIEELPMMEQIVLSLYHHEELTMPEIGRILGITQQKAQQIYSRSVFNLGVSVHDFNTIKHDLR
jgi:RNA polymerase sigma factor (sigma-70 family)